MEERNMQLDDDGKIKMRKNREDFLDHPEKEDDEEIVIDVPDFAGFREEDDNVGLSGDELSAKNQLYEQYVAEKKAQAEKIFEQAEALFAAGELESAGEKYLDSVAVHGGNWKAWFGVVRVQTKDMTDFSGIYDCQNAYNRALKRAGKAGKEELAATYDARLKQKIAENAEEAETLEEADAAYRASKRDGLSAALEASKKPFYLSLVCFAVALVAGIVLTCLINTVSGVQILIPAIYWTRRRLSRSSCRSCSSAISISRGSLIKRTRAASPPKRGVRRRNSVRKTNSSNPLSTIFTHNRKAGPKGPPFFRPLIILCKK